MLDEAEGEGEAGDGAIVDVVEFAGGDEGTVQEDEGGVVGALAEVEAGEEAGGERGTAGRIGRPGGLPAGPGA